MALSNVPSQGHASYFFSMYISMTLVVRNQYWVHKIRIVLAKEKVSGGTVGWPFMLLGVSSVPFGVPFRLPVLF